MVNSPVRFVLRGIVLVLLLAIAFVGGMSVGDPRPAVERLRAGPMPAGMMVCPEAARFATSAARDRASSCEAAQRVQELLVEAGAVAANVSADIEESRALVGPERLVNVTAQVFLPEPARELWDGRQAAEMIALEVGTTPDRVSIADDRLEVIYDGGAPTTMSRPRRMP